MTIIRTRSYPLDTRRVVNVRWTSYLGLSDVNYWRTPCGCKFSTSFKRNFWIAGTRSFFVVTIFERPKDVLIQKFFERWISTSFGRVILDMTNHDCLLNVDWTFKTDVTWTSFSEYVLTSYQKWNKTAWFWEKVKIGFLKVCRSLRA